VDDRALEGVSPQDCVLLCLADDAVGDDSFYLETSDVIGETFQEQLLSYFDSYVFILSLVLTFKYISLVTS